MYLQTCLAMTKRMEKECIMKLSDAFHDFQSDPACELKVKFENIRGKAGANLPVVRNCVIMKQYCDFMEIIFRYQAELNSQSTGEERQTCYERAIREAISKGILVDYLTRKGTEVINMFSDEYDYDLDMEVKAEEAREEGIQQKAVEAAVFIVKKYKTPPEEAAKDMNAPLELVLNALQ